MTREIDPPKKVPDAVEIDTSEMTIEEIVAKIIELAHDKQNIRPT